MKASRAPAWGALLPLLAGPCWAQPAPTPAAAPDPPFVAHAFVVLCDNQHQGILPVPQHLGNGQDLAGNLYWGARYGVRTFLTRDAGWRRIPWSGPVPSGVLQRLVLVSTLPRSSGRQRTAFVVADAWDGRQMRDALRHFFDAAAQARRGTIEASGTTLPIEGSAHVVAFVGHNGLMDFDLPGTLRAESTAPGPRAIVLACHSRSYFEDRLIGLGSYPLLLTSGLMAPEAYTLDAALRAWFETGNPAEVQDRAARAYARHQRCSLASARRLLVTGRR